ncbi:MULTISPECIES: hypothetical protein [unclassified Microbacterium]|uniref:hypothetical protein n=1 Tax=unclassified Microbacterium TaxID=2609290 RepID=UPI00301903AD
MSTAEQHFTAVVTVHATTSTPETDSLRDSYGREVRKVTTGKVRKDSTEVLKLQLRGSSVDEVSDKVTAVMAAIKGTEL